MLVGEKALKRFRFVIPKFYKLNFAK